MHTEATERCDRRKGRNESAKEIKAAQSLLLLRDAEETTELEETEGSVATQTELTSANVHAMQQLLTDQQQVIEDLTARLTQRLAPFSEESLQNDEMVEFYTGVPNIKVLKAVFELVVKAVPSSDTSSLSPFQEFMVTVVKLRQNCPAQDLAYRLNVSCATVSQIFLKWMTVMDIRLGFLILWPDCDAVCKTMPKCFRASFGTKVVVIIDCFEIFIERPFDLQARASTWSSSKHHNTVKVLLGIVPQGVVSFVSEPWGGCVSDKHLIEHCGILDKLLPGDVVLADRGFDIKDSVGAMQARLHIPAFIKGKSQLSAMELTETRTISNVCMPVERVIGNVQQKYSMLQSTLPIDYLIKQSGEERPVIDKIVRVCCALCNVCDSVVPFD